MPTSADDPTPDRLVDTSIAVALLVPDHDHHDQVIDALGKLRLGLAGHAAFETYSVLTRLPPPTRRTPAAASRLLEANFPASRFLGTKETMALLATLASSAIAGGQVYDSLVAAAAKHHGIVLATRDRRAVDVYRSLDVAFELID